MRILIVVAMQEEAEIIINNLSLESTKPSDNFIRHYRGNYHHKEVFLTTTEYEQQHHVSNVGTVPAAVNTYIGIKAYTPDLVINVGTAGGLKGKNICINDVYLSTKIYYYDHRIPIPGYQKYGLGNFTSADIPLNTNSIRKGIVCSGDSFDDNPTDYAVMNQLQCSVIDMEAAGVAWVCEKLTTPMTALKVVTNFVEEEAMQSNFLGNFHKSMDVLVKNLKLLLDYV